MAYKPGGELVPVGGGDPIPLIREDLTVGRLESCDVCLRLPNVSKTHCRFTFANGYWWVQDMGSTNGTKVNGTRIAGKKMLMPSDTVTIAKRTWTVTYTPPSDRPAIEEAVEEESILSQSLMERAGLVKRAPHPKTPVARPKVDPRKVLEPTEDDLADADDLLDVDDEDE